MEKDVPLTLMRKFPVTVAVMVVGKPLPLMKTVLTNVPKPWLPKKSNASGVAVMFATFVNDFCTEALQLLLQLAVTL